MAGFQSFLISGFQALQQAKLTRRDCLRQAGTAALLASLPRASGAAPPAPRPVAAVVTVYRPRCHADVLVGKILEGWTHDGGKKPALKLVSMYIDQFPPQDMARKIAAKYGVPLLPSIEQALTLGGNGLAVDGVLSIGEHGDYPFNEKEQQLYPRRRFFEQITDTFEKVGRVVSVFSDKHPGPLWADARWMVDRAREMHLPFMAGSSLPVGFRNPDLSLPMGCEIEAAVGVGYGAPDRYGFHALECFQTMLERRRDAETGIQWVEALTEQAMWKAIDKGTIRKDLLDAALKVVPTTKQDLRKFNGKNMGFLFKYNDGLLGAIFMLHNRVRGISVALKLKGKSHPTATWFEEKRRPWAHFAYQLKAIERMIHTGMPSYPVERTLLTAGALDAILNSRFENHRRLETPHLAIAYKPVDYPHAPHMDLGADPRKQWKGG